MRQSPARALDGVHQAGLAGSFLSDDDQLDGAVNDRVLVQRAEVLADVGGALREVVGNVDQRVVGECDAAQSAQRRHRDGQLRQSVVVESQVVERRQQTDIDR